MANGDKQFSYPMLDGWNTEDIVKVSQFYSAVATAYEASIATEDLMAAYHAFKEVVPSKAEEKQLGRTFEAESGYSMYRTIQMAKQNPKRIKMGE